MYLDRGKFTLRRQKRSRPGRVALYLALIVLGIYIIREQHQGNVRPMLMATPTATRSAVSFAEEAEAHFSAGRLRRAIETYQKATEAEPANAAYWVKLARLQVYAGDAEAGLESANTAVLVRRKTAAAHAVRAFALDWTGDYEEGSRASVRAIQLDPNNALAHAYYAEILTDLQKYAQAGDEARLAVSLNSNSMDVQRAYGYYLESVALMRMQSLPTKPRPQLTPTSA